MEVGDDELISSLALAADDLNRLDALLTSATLTNESLARKAQWCYSHVVNSFDSANSSNLEQGFLAGWIEYYLGAAGLRALLTPTWRMSSATLYVCWHMPEYPRVLEWVVKQDALILAAREAAWMRRIAGKQGMANFMSGERFAIIEAIRESRSIVTMLDYWYAGTRSVESRFLGSNCYTACGIVQLALNNGYSICLLSISADGRVTEEPMPISSNLQALIDAINAGLSQCIMEDPARWLLWPSLDRRWSEGMKSIVYGSTSR